MHNDPNWPRASAWLEGDHLAAPAAQMGVLGLPLNCSITPGRCDLAPNSIRDALQRFSPYDVEHDHDLRTVAVKDHGDLSLPNRPEDALKPIATGVANALSEAQALVLLGGDNGITRPAMHGLGLPLERCGLITLDAHLDLRDLECGLTNGNPVRALLADGLPGTSIVQIGIQPFANSSAYAWVASEAGISVITSDNVQDEGIDEVVMRALDMLDERADIIYFDLDVDVLDRAFAPACPGSRPGGLMPWQARRAAMLCGMHPKVRAMDLVEIDPTKDVAESTSLAAASCLLSFASGLRSRFEDFA